MMYKDFQFSIDLRTFDGWNGTALGCHKRHITFDIMTRMM